MIRTGDRKFFMMLQRRSNIYHSPEYAQSYRESDERGKAEERRTLNTISFESSVAVSSYVGGLPLCDKTMSLIEADQLMAEMLAVAVKPR